MSAKIEELEAMLEQEVERRVELEIARIVAASDAFIEMRVRTQLTMLCEELGLDASRINIIWPTYN
jgi:hypothetical protein